MHKWNSPDRDTRAIYWAKREIAPRQSRQLSEAFSPLLKSYLLTRSTQETSKQLQNIQQQQFYKNNPIQSVHWTTFLMCLFNLYLKMLSWMWWRRRSSEGQCLLCSIDKDREARTEVVRTCPEQKCPSWRSVLVLGRQESRRRTNSSGCRDAVGDEQTGRLDVTLQEQSWMKKFGI